MNENQHISGQRIFLIAASLICLPRFAEVIHALLLGRLHSPLVIGAGVFVNLAYCAWRGERWAYYFLMISNIVSLILLATYFPLASTFEEVLILAFSMLAALGGQVLLIAHPGAKAFMDEQKARFDKSEKPAS